MVEDGDELVFFYMGDAAQDVADAKERIDKATWQAKSKENSPNSPDVWPFNLTFHERLSGDLTLAPITLVKFEATFWLQDGAEEEQMTQSWPMRHPPRPREQWWGFHRYLNRCFMDYQWIKMLRQCPGSRRQRTDDLLYMFVIILPYPSCVSFVFLKHLTLTLGYLVWH